ncbi:MAG: O-antigen ligase family protein [Anaerolineales bacterium]|nr:O-antigen ligase family protein [Anaerolineales bacterium]
MRRPSWFDTTLFGEILVLVATAPVFFFSTWFPIWAVPTAIVLIALSWFWRRRRLGYWLARTPADLALLIFFALLVMAVAVAPAPLRQQYAWPRAAIMLWCGALFVVVATHSARQPALLKFWMAAFLGVGLAIALVAPLGIEWVYKLPVLGSLLDAIPSVLRGVFTGAENGFSPNQVAGALLYVWPVAAAFAVYWPSGHRLRDVRWWLVSIATLVMLVVLALTQSRAGLLGAATGAVLIVLLPWRWGRWLLAFLVVSVAVGLFIGRDQLMAQLADVSPTDGLHTLISRTAIWDAALRGVYDFPLTGMGLGTFRAIMSVLYPLDNYTVAYDLAHAHNFFLQTALDMGLPGLIALLAIYLLAGVQTIALWRRGTGVHSGCRICGLGFAAALVAQTVYSQLDAVALGSKPGFLLWFLFGLIFGAANLAFRTPVQDVT